MWHAHTAAGPCHPAGQGAPAAAAVCPWLTLTRPTAAVISTPPRPLQYASADRVELVTLFGYLEFCLTQIIMDNELGALREVGGRLGGRWMGRWVAGWVGRATSWTRCARWVLRGSWRLGSGAAGRAQRAWPRGRRLPACQSCLPPSAARPPACDKRTPSNTPTHSHLGRLWRASTPSLAPVATPSVTRRCCPRARTSTRWTPSPSPPPRRSRTHGWAGGQVDGRSCQGTERSTEGRGLSRVLQGSAGSGGRRRARYT